MAKVGVKYEGLHKRDTYEGLIDYLESKQEKIKFPNRDAKFVRDSPQYQSLLNEGFVEVEEQQLKQIKEEQAEHAVIRTANDTNETAKEVKVVAAQTQTDKPLIVKTNTRATQSLDVETKSTYSQASPQIFDMTVNDNMSKFKQDVESVEDTQQQNKQQQEQRVARMLQNHLQHEATPDTTIDFAHKIASMASSSVQTLGQGLHYLSSSTKPNAKAHDTSLLLGDGRGKQDYYVINTPQLTVGDKLPHKKKEQSKYPERAAMEIDDAVEKSKPKAKSQKTFDDEFQDLMADVENKPKPKPKSAGFPKPKPQPKAKTSMPPVIKRDKATKGTTKPASGLTTGVQIPPSKIGIQKLREELENAKNKNKLTAQDTSDYMKMYDDWKGAKGDKAKKDEKLKGLREIYKRVLYKKG